MSKPRILIVEDEPVVARDLQRTLERSGYIVPAVTASGEEALQRAEETRPDMALMDIVLRGDMDGIEAAQQLRSLMDIPVIFLTAYGDDEHLRRAKLTEPIGFLLKPFEERELLTTIEVAFAHHAASRQRVASALRESEARFRGAFDDATIGMALVSVDGRWQQVNRALCEITGYTESELLNFTWQAITHPDDLTNDLNHVRQMLAGATRHYQIEKRYLHKRGHIVWVRLSVTLIPDTQHRPRYFIAQIQDITEQKRAEHALQQAQAECQNTEAQLREQAALRQQSDTEKKLAEAKLLRAQRMESIGFLTGGIAHDLNNVLAPILMAVPLLRGKLTDEEGQQTLSLVESSALRGAELVNHLLTFYRGTGEERWLLQPRHLLRELTFLLRQTLSKALTVCNRAEGEYWPISGNAPQLQQMLMNLCVNAQDAMPQGGTLTLTAQNVLVDENYAGMTPGAKAGPYVILTVQDTGMGIPQENIDKIFEPFFTTKTAGQGTGLGLSTSLGIVKSHGGFMEVDSQIGQGTVFRIFLPAYPPVTAAPQAPAEAAALPAGSGELILVVDDEPTVRRVIRDTLVNHGYQVREAGDGVEAVTLFAQQRSAIKVVITDMFMPIMDGKTTINTLRHIDPKVRILVITGANALLQETGVRDLGIDGLLNKPFSSEQLLLTLKTVLERSAEPGPAAGSAS